jgi:hypothetical protein
MPALVCVSPGQFKRILELEGYVVLSEDHFNWVMAREGEIPIVLPKRGDRVGVDVTMDLVFNQTKMKAGRYLQLVEMTGGLPGGLPVIAVGDED